MLIYTNLFNTWPVAYRSCLSYVSCEFLILHSYFHYCLSFDAAIMTKK